jgi:hypothetical protein
MTVTVTIRPKARTEIRGLPWLEHGGNYAVLAECIGASRRGQVQYANGIFTVARSHTRALISALARRFGQVHVIQYGGVDKCGEACWNAKPETASGSEEGYAGALSVERHVYWCVLGGTRRDPADGPTSQAMARPVRTKKNSGPPIPTYREFRGPLPKLLSIDAQRAERFPPPALWPALSKAL